MKSNMSEFAKFFDRIKCETCALRFFVACRLHFRQMRYYIEK